MPTLRPPGALSVAERKALEGTPTLKKIDKANKKWLEDRYPRPDISEVMALWDEARVELSAWHADIAAKRIVRYGHDENPAEFAETLKYNRRTRTRLSNNEVLRVVGMITRNAPTVNIQPLGSTAAARKNAQKQTKWGNQFLQTFQRRSGKPILRTAVDNQAGDSLGCLLVYVTDAYQQLDDHFLERTMVEVEDPETGELTEREESDKEYLARTEEALLAAGSPIGVRTVDPLCVWVRPGENGPTAGMVVERKKRRSEFAAIRRSKGGAASQTIEEIEAATAPWRGGAGQPEFASSSSDPRAIDEVLTYQYWDDYWYVYIVEGVAVEGPMPHGLPGVPLFLLEGQVTGSPNQSERLQSIVENIVDMEVALNDLMTLEMDNNLTFGRPKPAIETDKDSNPLLDASGNMRPLDFSGGNVPQLNPGQKIVDGMAGFRPQPTVHMQQALQSFIQRSGLNPIDQGESPGADPAGYTVSSLQGAAQSHYEGLVDNLAIGLGRLYDFVRLMIRDTIKEKVYTSLPIMDNVKNTSEWMALGPEDIDESPSMVTIDPLSDANRLQKYQLLAQANEKGMVPRRLAQEALPGYEDGDLWDTEILTDAAVKDMATMAMEQAKKRITAKFDAENKANAPAPDPNAAPAMPPGMAPPPGAPLPPDPNAPPAAPAVGPEMAAASQGGSAAMEQGGAGGEILSSSRMRAGSPNGYVPQPGVMNGIGSAP